MKRRRLGWLGPAIVLVGIAVAAVGVYLMVHNKPKPGAVIDTLVIDANSRLVIRAEDGGDRSFVELHVGDELRWQALVPPYAGRPGTPGVAWSEVAVSVRVVRDHKAEVFALSMRDAEKLGGLHLGLDHGPIKENAPGPITLTDHIRSYEVVAGDGWNQLTALDLKTGLKLWVAEVGPAPITGAVVAGPMVVVEQGDQKRYFHIYTGKEDRSSEVTGVPIP